MHPTITIVGAFSLGDANFAVKEVEAYCKSGCQRPQRRNHAGRSFEVRHDLDVVEVEVGPFDPSLEEIDLDPTYRDALSSCGISNSIEVYYMEKTSRRPSHWTAAWDEAVFIEGAEHRINGESFFSVLDEALSQAARFCRRVDNIIFEETGYEILRSLDPAKVDLNRVFPDLSISPLTYRGVLLVPEWARNWPLGKYNEIVSTVHAEIRG